MRTYDFLPNAVRNDASILKGILKNFTYKPGWKFRLEDFGSFLVLCIDAEVPCTDEPGRMINIRFRENFDPLVHRAMDERAWMRWLRERILDVEKHEIDEFFKVDGVKVFDPHRND